MPFDQRYTDLPTALHGDVVVVPTEERDPVLRTIAGARALIERGWCQGRLAQDRNGNFARCLGAEAISFCAAGALLRSSVGYSYKAACLLVEQAAGGMIGIANDNPSTTKADVLGWLDKAADMRRASLLERACGGAGT